MEDGKWLWRGEEKRCQRSPTRWVLSNQFCLWLNERRECVALSSSWRQVISVRRLRCSGGWVCCVWLGWEAALLRRAVRWRWHIGRWNSSSGAWVRTLSAWILRWTWWLISSGTAGLNWTWIAGTACRRHAWIVRSASWSWWLIARRTRWIRCAWAGSSTAETRWLCLWSTSSWIWRISSASRSSDKVISNSLIGSLPLATSLTSLTSSLRVIVNVGIVAEETWRWVAIELIPPDAHEILLREDCSVRAKKVEGFVQSADVENLTTSLDVSVVAGELLLVAVERRFRDLREDWIIDFRFAGNGWVVAFLALILLARRRWSAASASTALNAWSESGSASWRLLRWNEASWWSASDGWWSLSTSSWACWSLTSGWVRWTASWSLSSRIWCATSWSLRSGIRLTSTGTWLRSTESRSGWWPLWWITSGAGSSGWEVVLSLRWIVVATARSLIGWERWSRVGWSRCRCWITAALWSGRALEASWATSSTANASYIRSIVVVTVLSLLR